MPIKGRVGRHAMAGGRECQNWASDQQVIIDLLNRIPSSEGGAQGGLHDRVISGISSQALYDAILTFERHNFPGHNSGYVDPNGPMLHRMEEVAARRAGNPAPAVASQESRLQTLRRNLLSDALAIKFDPFWAMHKVQFQPLIQMAEKHITSLEAMNLTALPWPVELFGRAFILAEHELLYHFPTFKSSAKKLFGGNGENPLFLRDADGNRIEGPELPEMSYGKPVDMKRAIYAARLPALLLYKTGGVARLPPYQYGLIFYLENPSDHYSHAPEYWQF